MNKIEELFSFNKDLVPVSLDLVHFFLVMLIIYLCTLWYLMRKSEDLYNVLTKYIQMLDLLRFDICYL
jgi:hypothetical protein